MAAQISKDASKGGRPTILVVDDDRDCREIVAEFLGTWGYQVDLASNGEEALAHLRDSDHPRPSLIILDLVMPVLDGWGFRQEQVHDPRLAGIPVVMISGAGEDLDNEYGSLQANEFMKKPIDYDRLNVVVDRYCP